MSTRLRYMAVWSLAAALAVACKDDVISDPSFDRWCDDKLCAWSTDEGKIARVASWHERDHAVELVGNPVQLSQYSDTTAECFAVKMLADVQAKTHTTVAVDFNDDGSIEFERTVTAAKWELVRFSISAPIAYDGLRFIVRKADAGKAVIAQLRAEASDGCTGARVELSDLPAGSLCSADRECASSMCMGGSCAECGSDDECTGDKAFCVAGYCTACGEDVDCPEGTRCAWSGDEPREGRECVDANASLERESLALCDHDQDCLDGTCGISLGDHEFCGTPCSTAAECAEGLACRTQLTSSWQLIQTCASKGLSGDLCREDGECEGGRCCDGLCSDSDVTCD